MICLTSHMRILVAVEPVDFRKGIDGLAKLCRERLAADPFTGAVFVFRSRGGTAIRLLTYDSRGFWLCHKRLSSGQFRFWPDGKGGAAQTLEPHQVQLLLCGGDPAAADTAPPPWRKIATS